MQTLNDCSFMYQRAYANKWIPGDGVLINLHGDSGEMLEVNPETGESKHVQLIAPLEIIRNRIKAMQKKGFKLVPAINLSCRKYAELGCPCCVVSASEEIPDLSDEEDDAIMLDLERACRCYD